MKTVARSGLFLAFLWMLGACTGMKEGKNAADVGVKEFHDRYSERRFDDILKGADTALQNSGDASQLVPLLEAVHRKLGAVRESKQQNVNVFSGTSGTRVTVTYATTFEHGTGQEMFVWTIKDKRAALLRYNISSQELILR
jgi:hypothetical protein